MKAIRFMGNSLECLREFPDDARQDAGYQLDQVQRGKQPSDFKPMPTVGKGVEELRVRDDAGTYRVIYLGRMRWSCCTPSKKRPGPPTGRTSTSPRVGTRN